MLAADGPGEGPQQPTVDVYRPVLYVRSRQPEGGGGAVVVRRRVGIKISSLFILFIIIIIYSFETSHQYAGKQTAPKHELILTS